MEIYYGSKGIDNYIEASVFNDIILKSSPDNYRLKMLENNEIEGLIRPVTMEVDGRLILKYNTCSCYVLHRLFQRFKPDGSFLGIIMEQLELTLQKIRCFLLNPDDVVLAPEYMFYNWGEKKLRLIYIPGYGKNIKIQMKAFLEYVMKIFDHRDENGVRYMYGIYELISEDTFSMEDFCYRLYGKDNYILEEPEVKYGDCCEQENPMPVSRVPIKLVPLTNGALSEIVFSKYDEMILVGRGKRDNDYRLATTGISRVHACIYLRGTGVFVEDRESTNGTFVNSVRLEALKQEEIHVGDIVNFANEEFFAV